ncbi:YhjD/YihY/BrkB family envelope integrity protein, partial [Acinetobacter baumannii]
MVTAIITMLTVDRALNDLWHVKKPRPLRQRVLVYWAALSLGPLLIGGSLSLTSYIASKSGSLVALMPEVFNELLSL